MTSCSVIVPCYNGARFLPDTIASVLGQTRPPQEIIVVDDGSTDDSASVAGGLSPLVRVLRQENQGESAARNRGLKAATGDYLLFLDADDLLAPESIARLTEAVSGKPGAVAVMGVAMFTADPSAITERHLPAYEAFFPALSRTNFGPPHCWFTPRALALQVGGFREDLVHSEDWEFWGRIGLTGALLVSVPYEGALYRRHPGSQVATSSKPEILQGRLTVAVTLADGMLARPELLEQAGEAMFWSLWAMREGSRSAGVRGPLVARADSLLKALARQGPRRLSGSWSAMAVRLLGAETAARLRALRPNDSR